jgi:hypothetical protein
MNAGHPGTGIGGLFSILSAFRMPAHRALNGRTHDGRSSKRATGQAAIAAGVLLALFATGWLLGLMIAPDVGTVPGGLRAAENAKRWLAVAGTAGLLIGALLAVEALLLYLQARARFTAVRAVRRQRRSRAE